MFKVYAKNSRNKLRDINISIEYHCTGNTLQQLSEKYEITKERVRQIHYWYVRHVLTCLNKYEGIYQTMKHHHCIEVANHLKEYKKFLIGNKII